MCRNAITVVVRPQGRLEGRASEEIETVRTGRVCLTRMRPAARAELSSRSPEQAHPGLRLAV